VNKGLETDLGAWLVVAMRGFPMDQSQAQVQGFNEDGGISKRNTL